MANFFVMQKGKTMRRKQEIHSRFFFFARKNVMLSMFNFVELLARSSLRYIFRWKHDVLPRSLNGNQTDPMKMKMKKKKQEQENENN